MDDSAAIQFSEQYYTSIKNGNDEFFCVLLRSRTFYALAIYESTYDWKIEMEPSSQDDKKILTDRQVEKKRANLNFKGTLPPFQQI